MPNHVTSEIIFHGVSVADQEAILAKVCNAEGRVDFEILVPTPLNLWMGNEGSNHEKAFGKRLGMTWTRENWGTKWNAYDCRPVQRTEDTLTIIFDTAWSPPFPWLAAVFNHFKRSFDHNWLDEGASWSVEGKFKWTPDDPMGLGWAEERASRETQERLHTLKWGCAQFDDEDEDDGLGPPARTAGGFLRLRVGAGTMAKPPLSEILIIDPKVERVLGKSAAQLSKMSLSALSDLVFSKGLWIECVPRGGRVKGLTVVMMDGQSATSADQT